MTSSANDAWDYDKLLYGISILENAKAMIQERGVIQSIKDWSARDIQHTIDFLEYNMEQSEITGGNGD